MQQVSFRRMDEGTPADYALLNRLEDEFVAALPERILAALNVYQFASDAWPIPLWLVGLWLIFPTTLGHGLRWCWSGKPWILAASAIGAALTYIGGARLSDLVFPLGELSSVVIISGCWMLYFGLVRVMSSEKS